MKTANKKLLVGRTIVDFELGPWRDKQGLHHHPAIELDNGARIYFGVSEAEGDYGVTPRYYPPPKKLKRLVGK